MFCNSPWECLKIEVECKHGNAVSQWRRKWQPTPVFMSGKSHGLRSLVGYNPWGRKQSDMTERLLCVCDSLQCLCLSLFFLPHFYIVCYACVWFHILRTRESSRLRFLHFHFRYSPCTSLIIVSVSIWSNLVYLSPAFLLGTPLPCPLGRVFFILEGQCDFGFHILIALSLSSSRGHFSYFDMVLSFPLL